MQPFVLQVAGALDDGGEQDDERGPDQPFVRALFNKQRQQQQMQGGRGSKAGAKAKLQPDAGPSAAELERMQVGTGTAAPRCCHPHNPLHLVVLPPTSSRPYHKLLCALGESYKQAPFWSCCVAVSSKSLSHALHGQHVAQVRVSFWAATRRPWTNS